MNWDGRNVLVTGAGGFIGSHLAERMVAAGASVRAFVHYNGSGRRGWLEESNLVSQMDVIAGDVRDVETVNNAMAGIDTVFHLAALIGIPYSRVAPLVHHYVPILKELIMCSKPPSTPAQGE